MGDDGSEIKISSFVKTTIRRGVNTDGLAARRAALRCLVSGRHVRIFAVLGKQALRLTANVLCLAGNLCTLCRCTVYPCGLGWIPMCRQEPGTF